MADAHDRTPEGGNGQLWAESSSEEGFRGPQVCKLVGISYRQLDYWARTDLIRPSLVDARIHELEQTRARPAKRAGGAVTARAGG